MKDSGTVGVVAGREASVGYMGKAGKAKTKICPNCGEELFADMDVCYGCLYDFSRPPGPMSTTCLGQLAGEGGDGRTCAQSVHESVSGNGTSHKDSSDLDTTMPLNIPSSNLPRWKRKMLWVRSPDMEVKIPVPESELTVGRDQCCDVVLHSMAVSRRHVGFKCVSEGLRVRNLGAKNLATVGGREVQESCILGHGQTVNVCGTLFTFVTPDE